MKFKLYQVDAFAQKVFTGNPAAVCPLAEWLPDSLLRGIAAENNLSETAFYVPQGEGYEIRWFTPTVEVDLCGHATLATAYVLFNHEQHAGNTIEFISPRSGQLIVSKNGELLTLNFPADEFRSVDKVEELMACFEQRPSAIVKGKTDYLFEFDDENDVQTIRPNFKQIASLDARGIIVTAKGGQTDFVSRFFAPAVGVNEDPVCGSAHTTLIPYWAAKLAKTKMTAAVLSERTGLLSCELLGQRVTIGGPGKLYLEGTIYVDEV